MLLDIIVVNKNEYAIMVPAEDAELENGEAEEQEAVIFRIDENEDGEQTLVAIDDDEEWDSVAAAWEEQAGMRKNNGKTGEKSIIMGKQLRLALGIAALIIVILGVALLYK